MHGVIEAEDLLGLTREDRVLQQHHLARYAGPVHRSRYRSCSYATVIGNSSTSDWNGAPE
jgi:hypothetical protein